MFAAYVNSLHEAFNRRMGLILVGLGILLAGALNWIVHIRPLPGGDTMVLFGNRMLGPGSLATPAIYTSELQIIGELFWILLSILAAAPLLASTLDRGWLELTLSKGTARWKIFLGRYFGGVSLYLAASLLAMLPLAIRMAIVTHTSIWSFIVAMLIQTYSFAALLSLAALACLPQLGPAPPVLLGIFASILAPVLQYRERGLYQVLTGSLSRHVLDWAYKIMPKTTELLGMGVTLIQEHHVDSWWPFWSTGVFTAVTLSLTLWVLQRKSL
jgi:hypothetical protein